MIPITVIIDNCAVDRFAARGINPADHLRGTEFLLAYTPDLKTEYQAALANKSVPMLAKQIINSILATGKQTGFFGFDGGPFLGFDQGTWAGQEQMEVLEAAPTKASSRDLPRKRTDVHLVALSAHAVVITDNTKEGHWRKSLAGTGAIIQWAHLEQLLSTLDLLAALRSLIKGTAGAESSWTSS
jgi:hypothetical protein